MLWVKAGDQAPVTTSAEAAERGEEEQAAAQHCCNSGSGGNESKGTAHTVPQQTALGIILMPSVQLPLQHCDSIRKQDKNNSGERKLIFFHS